MINISNKTIPNLKIDKLISNSIDLKGKGSSLLTNGYFPLPNGLIFKYFKVGTTKTEWVGKILFKNIEGIGGSFEHSCLFASNNICYFGGSNEPPTIEFNNYDKDGINMRKLTAQDHSGNGTEDIIHVFAIGY